MSSKVALSFSNSLFDFYVGNQGIVNAVGEIISLNAETVAEQQNNTYGLYLYCVYI